MNNYLLAFSLAASVFTAAAIMAVGVFRSKLLVLRGCSREAMAQLIRMLDRHDNMAGEIGRDIAGAVHPSLRQMPNSSPFTRRDSDAGAWS